MQKDNRYLKHLIESVVRQTLNEGFEEEEDYFDEYEKDYPNSGYQRPNMSQTDLANWCQKTGAFLFLYKSFYGWRINVANTDAAVQEIASDILNCAYIEPTHDMDYLLYSREREFVYDYVTVFRLKDTPDGTYYVIYQEPKN